MTHPSLAPHGMKPDNRESVTQAAEIAALRAENAELRELVVAFCGPWAATFARNSGYPQHHLHPTHYDILARAGARMDDFVRHDNGIASHAGQEMKK